VQQTDRRSIVLMIVTLSCLSVRRLSNRRRCCMDVHHLPAHVAPGLFMRIW
jgi:hypothetical protein